MSLEGSDLLKKSPIHVTCLGVFSIPWGIEITNGRNPNLPRRDRRASDIVPVEQGHLAPTEVDFRPNIH